MKKVASLILVSLAVLLFTAFSTPTRWETQKVNRLYSIDIPSYLNKTDDLNDEASLQYQNEDEELYIIILDENKKEFMEAVNELLEDETISDEEILDVYAYLQFTTFATDEDYDSSLEYLEINGLNARELDVIDYMEDYTVFYKMACYEGKDNLYFLVSWTTSDNKDRLNPDLQNIINSFKLL